MYCCVIMLNNIVRKTLWNPVLSTLQTVVQFLLCRWISNSKPEYTGCIKKRFTVGKGLLMQKAFDAFNKIL